MSINEKDLNEFKEKNVDKLKMLGGLAKSALGKDADKLNDLLSDNEKLKKITSNLTKNDLDKIATLLNNPDALKRLLSDEKAKKNIKKMMGD